MQGSATRLELRPEEASDEAFCRRLFASAFLRMQFDAQQRGHRAQFPRAERSLVLAKGEAIGRMVVDRSGEAMHLVDVALLPEQRGQGQGAQLLGRLIDEARAAGRALHLSVLRSNPAARLYTRLGFARSGGDDLYDVMIWSPPGAAKESSGQPRLVG
jgi:ribosomal protein S18 acetylase RimI-like enzyme